MLSTEEEQNTTLERTFAAVKTDAGTIHQWIQKQGFSIIDSKLTCLQHERWESFKRQKVDVFILEKINAVKEWNDAISNDSDFISNENAYGSPTIEQARQDISLVFNDQVNKGVDIPQDISNSVNATKIESNEKEHDDKTCITEESNKLGDISNTTNTEQENAQQIPETQENNTVEGVEPLSDEKKSIHEIPIHEVKEEQQEDIAEQEPMDDQAPKEAVTTEEVPDKDVVKDMIPKKESNDAKVDKSHEENALNPVESMVAEKPSIEQQVPENKSNDEKRDQEENVQKKDTRHIKEEQAKTRSNELQDDAVKPSCSRLRQPAMRRGNSLIHSEKELNGSSKLPTGSTRIARLNTSSKKATSKVVKKEDIKPKKMVPDFISRLTAPTVASKSKKAERTTKSKKQPIIKNKRDTAGGLVTTSSNLQKNGHKTN